MNEERRHQLVEQARRLHAEGRFGGAKFGRLGGRPRKVRLGELLAEEAIKHRDEIVAALRAGLHPSCSPSTRAKSAELWSRIAAREGELAQREEHDGHAEALDVASMSTDELREYVLARLVAAFPSGELLDVIEAGPPASAVE